MTALDNAVPPPGVIRGRTFFGEPRALAYLSFTEAWERFSYYGMTALLVLYMSEQLLLPGHVEHVAGFAAFRHELEAVFGHMSTLALASQIFGLYTGFVYFTPVFGGLIADRWLGRRNAVVLGAILMSMGHIAMAFDVSFLLALSLLIVGCGFLKGNISAQVGALYAETDGPGRTRGFSIYSTGINVGAVAGPLGCGLLAQLYGWHAGFGLAGILMLIGLATYLAGYKTLTEETPVSNFSQPDAKLDARQWRLIAIILGIISLSIFQSIAYNQNTNMNLIWIDRSVDLNLLGFHVPVAWFNSIDSFVSIIVLPPLLWLWRWQSRHGGEPNEVMKISIGAWMAAAANIILVIGCMLDKRVPVFYPVIYDIILGVAFLYYWPTMLSLVSRAAPPGVKATMMGFVFFSSFIASFLVGWIGQFYESMTPTQFWLLHGAIAAAGGLLAMILAGPLGRFLAKETANG
jgi:POT family proton-dependent oligopeptide transporter